MAPKLREAIQITLNNSTFQQTNQAIKMRKWLLNNSEYAEESYIAMTIYIASLKTCQFIKLQLTQQSAIDLHNILSH